MFKDDLEILPGTVLKSLVTAAPAAYAGYQAINANIKYGQEVDKIESLLENRQAITNPYKNIENPYKNLPVATQAARFQAENADIALANTLDTLRATGAAAGGATALAQAALQSQQGISASLEKQEAQNARLRAQGQLQVDAAKAKGETFRMRMQEARDVRDINRIQRQADIFKATQIASGLETLASGVLPKQKDAEFLADQKKSIPMLTPRPGVTSNQPEAQLQKQKVGIDPLADFEGTEAFTSKVPTRGLQRINNLPQISRVSGLQGLGTEYEGVPMEGQVPFIQPRINFIPEALQTFTPSSNLFNDPFASLTGYDLSKTYKDPVTGLVLTQ